MASLRSVHLKLIRAEEHLQAFKTEIALFQETGPFRIEEDRETDPDAVLVTFRGRNFPNARWSVVLGDFIHNLRSALDLLASELVSAAGNEPVHDVYPKTHFPILTKRPDAKNGLVGQANIPGGIRDESRSLLDSVQPYQRSKPALHPLAILQELSNKDKHQQLNVVLSFIPFVKSGVHGLEGLVTPPTIHPQPILVDRTIRIPYEGPLTRDRKLRLEWEVIVMPPLDWDHSEDETGDAAALLEHLFYYVCLQVVDSFRRLNFPDEKPVHLANPLPARPWRRKKPQTP